MSGARMVFRFLLTLILCFIMVTTISLLLQARKVVVPDKEDCNWMYDKGKLLLTPQQDTYLPGYASEYYASLATAYFQMYLACMERNKK
jgi:hypothetical protein